MTLRIPATLDSQAKTCRSQALALCWRITWQEAPGTIFRFTDWPHQLQLREADGAALNSYTPTDGLDASARRRAAELESTNKETRGVVSSSAISAEDLRAGRFDGAVVDEYLVDPRAAWLGYIEHNRYTIRTVKFDGLIWTAEIEGLTARLDRPVGALWGPFCRVALFSTPCGLNPVDFEEAVDVDSVTTPDYKIVVSFSPMPAAWNVEGYANEGTLVWLTGANAGLVDDIKEYVPTDPTAAVTLHRPARYAIQAGDTATIRPGCAKTYEACRDKFSNLVNFQGEPFIPGRDVVLRGIPVR